MDVLTVKQALTRKGTVNCGIKEYAGMRPGFGKCQSSHSGGVAAGTIPSVRGSINSLLPLLLAVFFCWLLSPAALAGEAAKPEQIILTWTQDPAVSQTITWLIPDNSPARVQYLRAVSYTHLTLPTKRIV